MTNTPEPKRVITAQRQAILDFDRLFTGRGGKGAPVRRAFMHVPPEGNSPLMQIMSGRAARAGGGGRGGKTRLALLLSLLWILAKPPHETQRPASAWAALIGLPDPTVTGARAIRDSLDELNKRGFLNVTPPARRGEPSTVALRNESCSGEAYTLPDPYAGEYYFRVPEALWRRSLIQDLSGPGLVMYLVVMSIHHTDDPDMVMFFPAQRMKDLYGISDTTRKKGLRELTALGVLNRATASRDHAGGTTRRTHRRHLYQLNPTYGHPTAE